jgi:hypothetical protein
MGVFQCTRTPLGHALCCSTPWTLPKGVDGEIGLHFGEVNRDLFKSAHIPLYHISRP